MAAHKSTGLPIVEGLKSAADLPHTISYAVLYRTRIDSFNELPKSKQPPRYMWDRPHELSEFLEHVWDREDTGDGKYRPSKVYEYNLEDVE